MALRFVNWYKNLHPSKKLDLAFDTGSTKGSLAAIVAGTWRPSSAFAASVELATKRQIDRCEIALTCAQCPHAPKRLRLPLADDLMS